jgi:hypothetical protein
MEFGITLGETFTVSNSSLSVSAQPVPLLVGQLLPTKQAWTPEVIHMNQPERRSFTIRLAFWLEPAVPAPLPRGFNKL